MKDIDKVRGAMYGVAVGDALGAPLEFMRPEEIKATYGAMPVRDMKSGGWLNVEQGEVTDDTQMTLAVAQGIIENPDDPVPCIGRRFIAWANSRPKDIGATCHAAISRARLCNAQTKEAWLVVGRAIAEGNGHRSGGNGALMRTVYPGLFYGSAKAAGERAAEIAEMTHHDEVSTDLCSLYAKMIFAAVTDEKDAALLAMTEWLRRNPMPENPTGWAKDSIKCAFESVAQKATFEDAVIRAVNLGGDADTIGAITGGIAGAIYGFGAIPKRWKNKLAPVIRKTLDELAEAAVSAK